jgi:hypothetical protein
MTDDFDIGLVQDLGLDLVVLGTIISVLGVIANNLLLAHILAMQIWMFSNLIFAVYFYGRWKQWWDGGLSDQIMCGLYLFMLISGLWGLGV